VVNAVEKSDSYNRGWRSIQNKGKDTHQYVDHWAKDINWGGGNDDEGSPLFTSFDGQVIFVGRVSSSVNSSANNYGNQVIVYNSAKKLAVRFAHLKKTIAPMSQLLRTGDYIGDLGGTGNVTAPHLHLVVYENIDSTALSYLQEGKFPTGESWTSSGYSNKNVAFGYDDLFELRDAND
jgi:murein DD-endopeptidase MepM/ murein hydrolase activator NlpD